MVSKDYLQGYQEASHEFAQIVEDAVKRYNGAKTVSDCVKALNDIIVASHRLRQISVPEKDEVDEMESALKMLFPNATFVKFTGGDSL